MLTVVNNPGEWFAGHDGGAYTKPAPVRGLEQIDDLRQPVRVTAPGVYTAFDRTAVYTSTDGLRFTRHELSPS
ncbi:hypothetical protein [Dactylosporangium sp. CA-233914]|uniref:hypothetical protein n=1 Tax=Dactylosporangium sp. CA-233914 TaxID=3239934 RepID=UPI003D8E84E0